MQITKLFTFDSGHRLSNYQGKCKSLHGHTYKLEVTIEGELDKMGMVMDFGELKEIIKQKVDSKFDHKLILFQDDQINKQIAESIPPDEEWIVWVNYNPTAENLALDISDIIKKELKPRKITLAKVKLWETPTSYAEVS